MSRNNDPTTENALRMAECMLLAFAEQWEAKSLPADFFLLPYDLGETVSTVQYALNGGKAEKSVLMAFEEAIAAGKARVAACTCPVIEAGKPIPPISPTCPIHGEAPWPVIFCEGGLVQDVIFLSKGENYGPKAGAEYEVMDYDMLRDNGSEEIAEYWENRSPELREYMRRYLPREYAEFEEESELAQKIQQDKLNPPKPLPTLLEAAKEALAMLKKVQEDTDEEAHAGMPWPEIDTLEQAIQRESEGK